MVELKKEVYGNNTSIGLEKYNFREDNLNYCYELSFIIPVYNGEKYIHKCIESIFKISSIKFECLIINDGSTDNTLSIINDFVGSDDRFKCINISNSGVSVARNIGLKEAKGKKVFFIDADDWLLDNSEDLLKSGLKKAVDTITLYEYLKEFPNGKIEYHKFPEIDKLNYFETLRILLVSNESLYNCWGIIFDKYIIDLYKIHFDETMTIGEDACFVLDYLKHVSKIDIIRHPILTYYQNSHSATHNILSKDIKDEEKFFSKKINILTDLKLTISKYDLGTLCNIYFTHVIIALRNECGKSKVLKGRKIIKHYGDSKFFLYLLQNCRPKDFSVPKQFLFYAMRRRVWILCYFILFIFSKKSDTGV